LLGAPLDAEERRNLGRYVKVLVEKQEASAADLLRFCSHYATRRAKNAGIKPSQAWGDVVASGGGGYRPRTGLPGSNAVVGATEADYEGDF
jgi:hypothetical protein